MRTVPKPVEARFILPASKDEKRGGTVLVYTAELLPYSETFVRDHVASLKDRDAVLVGAKSIEGLSTADLTTALLPNSRAARLLLWLTGISPSLDRVVDRHRVKLIHAHFAGAGARLAAYARRRGLPLVVTLHGSDVLRRPGRHPRELVTRLLWRRLMRSADLFLPVSDHLARKAAERGFPEAKLRRHHLGIPLFPAAAARPDAPVPTILFIGRLVEKKGLPYLLSACQMMARGGHDFRLKIIGDGPMLDRCRRQAESMPERVTFLGRLSPERVRDELSRADILCMPSVEAADGDNEGLPIVALEAQAAGLPIVAFDQGPVPECMRASETGLLAKEACAEDLASCIGRLLDDPESRRRLGAQGRRYVEGHFNIERQTEKLERIYEQLLSEGAQRSVLNVDRGEGQKSWQRAQLP